MAQALNTEKPGDGGISLVASEALQTIQSLLLHKARVSERIGVQTIQLLKDACIDGLRTIYFFWGHFRAPDNEMRLVGYSSSRGRGDQFTMDFQSSLHGAEG